MLLKAGDRFKEATVRTDLTVYNRSKKEKIYEALFNSTCMYKKCHKLCGKKVFVHEEERCYRGN